jgi:hypothetical protein
MLLLMICVAAGPSIAARGTTSTRGSLVEHHPCIILTCSMSTVPAASWH